MNIFHMDLWKVYDSICVAIYLVKEAKHFWHLLSQSRMLLAVWLVKEVEPFWQSVT